MCAQSGSARSPHMQWLGSVQKDTVQRIPPHKNWMVSSVAHRLKDSRADNSFEKTIKYESDKFQLYAFNKPVACPNMKEIITIQFTSVDKARANPWVHRSDPF